jgi:peptidoglycan/LPS O-acetylase OafA/YrhL
MIAAQLVAVDMLGRYFRSVLWSLVALGLLAAVLVVYRAKWLEGVLLFLIFMVLVNDSPMVAFLRWPATKFLGTISYSVYLMHGIVLFVVFAAVNQIVSIKTLTPGGFWSLTCCCGLLTILVSAFTYRFVEHPFLSSKGSVGVAISRPLEAQAPQVPRAAIDAGQIVCVEADTP